MMIRIVLNALVLSATVFCGTAAHAQMSQDKKQAIGAVIEFRKAYVEGRLADALAMSPACVLTTMAAEQGLTPEAMIQARRDENAAIRLLAKSGNYVFQTDVSRHEVTVISEDLKVFTFNATAQLGPIMPVQKSSMAAIYDGSGWYVTSIKSRKDRQMLAGCYKGLRARDLK